MAEKKVSGHGFKDGVPMSVDRTTERHILTNSGPIPSMWTQKVQHYAHNGKIASEKKYERPFAGYTHWNSLQWNNFPPLYIFGSAMVEYGDSDFYKMVRSQNSDGKLAEQWVTFEAARQDLSLNTKMPKGKKTLKVECVHFDGQRNTAFRFPMVGFMPKRDNHMPYDVQARRFWDNTGVNFGVNAMDFAEKVKPLADVESYVHMNAISGNPTWGYYHAIMKVGGWPYRISRIGSFEGEAEGDSSFSTSIHYWDEQFMFNLLEGGPEMVSQGKDAMVLKDATAFVGKKMFAELYEMDWLGPKRNESVAEDPEIPLAKGHVWFTIEESCIEPQSGQKAVRIRILDEGIIPCWMDTKYLQVWVGDTPLGYFNEAVAEEDASGKVKVHRVLDGTMDSAGNPNSKRHLVAENAYSKVNFVDPDDQDQYENIDMGWAIKDVLYRGCSLTVSGRPGAWAEEDAFGKDEGVTIHKSIKWPFMDRGYIRELSYHAQPSDGGNRFVDHGYVSQWW